MRASENESRGPLIISYVPHLWGKYRYKIILGKHDDDDNNNNNNGDDDDDDGDNDDNDDDDDDNSNIYGHWSRGGCIVSLPRENGGSRRRPQESRVAPLASASNPFATPDKVTATKGRWDICALVVNLSSSGGHKIKYKNNHHNGAVSNTDENE